jgi:flagella basal body P-ring formation protein FlgA
MTFIFSKLIRVLSLCAVALAGSAPAFSLTEMRMVDGHEIREAITERLAAAGEHAAPNVLAEKKFYVCDQPLRVEPAFDSWLSVDVVCPSPAEWKITVRAQVKGQTPPDLPNTAGTVTEAVFLTRPLRRGDRILSDDVELRAIDPLSSASVYSDPGMVIGRLLSQSLTTRSPLMPRHLQREWTVNENDRLSLHIVRGGIEILATGVALEKGQLGDTIRARNPRSGKVLEGRIIGERKIEIISKSFD